MRTPDPARASTPSPQQPDTPKEQILRQQLLDICHKFEDREFMAAHGKCDLDLAAPRCAKRVRAIEALIEADRNKAAESARIGWTLELPDLPYFQIKAFDKSRFNKEWVSPIYDTKNLPATLQSEQRSGGQDE